MADSVRYRLEVAEFSDDAQFSTLEAVLLQHSPRSCILPQDRKSNTKRTARTQLSSHGQGAQRRLAPHPTTPPPRCVQMTCTGSTNCSTAPPSLGRTAKVRSLLPRLGLPRRSAIAHSLPPCLPLSLRDGFSAVLSVRGVQ